MNSVLITGSSKGLGESLAEIFALNEYNIILHGRNKQKLEEIKKHLIELKQNLDVLIVYGDLKNKETIDRLAKEADRKNVSVLINNAAITCPGLNLNDLKDEQISDMIQVNLIAPIILTKKIYSLFIQRGEGTIININSLVGLEPKKPRTIYCASKWGLRGFSESLRLESEGNIKVMEVYLSKMKNFGHPYGMNLKLIAKEIYKQCDNGVERLIIDGRPEKRIIEWKEAKVIDGKQFEI